jgi:polyisoprenoid-binding protein YceI
MLKKTFLNLVILSGLAAGSISCKNEPKNKVEVSDAREAEVVSSEAMSFEVIPAESTIHWRGTKPTGEHRGTVAINSGELKATEKELLGGTVVINMTSIAVTDEDISEKGRTNLEDHLKGTVEGKETDFFNVTKYPDAEFEITGMSEKNGARMLEGNLRIKGKTNHIEFPVTATIGKDKLTLKSETFTIDRTDWNVNYGSKSVFDDLGDKFISDDMEISIEVTAERIEQTRS